MKIAVATDNGNVSAHFGHCTGFTIYETEDGNVKSSGFVPNPGHEPGFLPVFLSGLGVGMIIAGGMGERAQTLFSRSNIETVVGVSGTADEAIKKYLSGSLESAGEYCTEHAHEKSCSSH